MICIDGLSSQELSKVLDFIYNGEVDIPQANVENFMGSAQRFRLNGVSLNENDKVQKVTKENAAFFMRKSNIIQDDFIFEDMDIKKEDVVKFNLANGHNLDN